MATDFPTNLDTYTDPTSGAFLNNPSHSVQHQNHNDSIEAIEAKVGANSSAVTTSHDYKLSGVTGSDKAASKAGTETLTNKTVSLTSNTLVATSAQLATAITDETGTGSVVFATSPTLVTPAVDTINESTPANGVAVDGLNIKDSKLNTNNSVVTANITNDAVTATKIDWASTGADGGIWWEEIGRTTLGSAGDTITVSSLPDRKYLRILCTGIASGGTLDTTFIFNNDTGANYAYRYSANHGAETAQVSQASVPVESGATDSGQLLTLEIELYNIATQEKNFKWKGQSQDAAGGATNITIIEGFGKWANLTNAINRIDWSNTGTGNFAIGSEVVVLGHN